MHPIFLPCHLHPTFLQFSYYLTAASFLWVPQARPPPQVLQLVVLRVPSSALDSSVCTLFLSDQMISFKSMTLDMCLWATQSFTPLSISSWLSPCCHSGLSWSVSSSDKLPKPTQQSLTPNGWFLLSSTQHPRVAGSLLIDLLKLCQIVLCPLPAACFLAGIPTEKVQSIHERDSEDKESRNHQAQSSSSHHFGRRNTWPFLGNLHHQQPRM